MAGHEVLLRGQCPGPRAAGHLGVAHHLRGGAGRGATCQARRPTGEETGESQGKRGNDQLIHYIYILYINTLTIYIYIFIYLYYKYIYIYDMDDATLRHAT